MQPVSTHTFNRAVSETLKISEEISSQRGGEYNDSWSLENFHTPYLDNLFRSNYVDVTDPEFKRLILMASMLDIKLSRLGGPWKDDTALDTINYLAVYTSLRGAFERRREQKSKTQVVERQAQANPITTSAFSQQATGLVGATNGSPSYAKTFDRACP